MKRPVTVLAVVGTDHHPFDRLVHWVDAWALTHPDVPVLIQRGTSVPTRNARCVDYLDHDELSALMRTASVVVSHGGPTTIQEARRLGRVPLVVPRDPAFGEHVDGHQMRFAAHLSSAGLIRLASDQQELSALVEGALDDPDTFTVPDSADWAAQSATTCRAFEDAVASMFAQPARRRRLWRRLEVSV